MLRAEGDLPIDFCARCGGWSSRRAHRLARPCGPPSAAGRLALKRIEKGLHPWRAKGAEGGGDKPRGRLVTVARKRRAEDMGEDATGCDDGSEGGLGADAHQATQGGVHERDDMYSSEQDVFGYRSMP